MLTFLLSLQHYLELMEMTTLFCDCSKLAVSLHLCGQQHGSHQIYFLLRKPVFFSLLFLGPFQMLSETSQG